MQGGFNTIRPSVRGTTFRFPTVMDRAQTMRSSRVGKRNAVFRQRLNAVTGGSTQYKGEFKSIDYSNALAVNTGTTIALLNGCARGDDIGERDGRETMMKSIQLSGYIAPTVGTGVDQQARILLVYDRQTNGVALGSADVLENADVRGFRKLENRKRFKILMDKKFALSASGEANSNQVFEFYRRLRHPVTYNSGSAGTVADIATGSLYIVVIGTEVAGATAGLCTFRTRVRFQDQ